MRPILRGTVAALLVWTSIAVAAEPKVPDSFLAATGGAKKVLETPVSGTFEKKPASDVISELCGQLPANNVYKRDKERPQPTFTGTFKNTPLRTALYNVARSTGIKVELVDRGDGTKLISAHE